MIRMLGNRLLIAPCRNSELSQGGVYTGKAKTTFIRQNATNEQVCQGTVVAVGNGARNKRGKRVPVDVSVGETVMFSDSCGHEIIENGRPYIVIREDDIAGFLDTPVETVEVVNG